MTDPLKREWRELGQAADTIVRVAQKTRHETYEISHAALLKLQRALKAVRESM